MANTNSSLRVMHVISGDLWAGAEVQAYTLIKQLQEHCVVSVLLLNPGRLADELQKLGIRVAVLDEARMGPLALLIGMRQAMREFRPQVVHTHRQKENILGSLANWLSVRAKCVRTVHGAPEIYPQGRQKLQVGLDRWVGRHLQDGIIAVSQHLAEALQPLFSSRKIHLIRNGIDAAALNAGSRPADFRRAMPECLHIGIIGRLEPVKRVDIFLDMIAQLDTQNVSRKLHFHVIGEGRLRGELELRAESLGVLGKIKFHGQRNDIASCISSLDVVVMCSDHEGTPMTALEAMALGIPLVAHQVGGLSELLYEYPELLVQDHSPQGYARAVNRQLTQPTKNLALPEDYTAQENGVRTLSLYRRLAL